MAKDSVVEQIVKSLSFEVEAVPQDNVVQVTTTSNATPMNVKIRVRKKSAAGLRQGILSVPKPDKPDNIPERIRLASSDQTIMSFNVVMEAEFNKPMKKSRKTLLGALMPTICLGAQSEEDSYMYMPKSYEASITDETYCQSERALRSAFTLTKDEKQAERMKSPKRNTYFGKCKPGGCLDPPFGEDRQPYTPAPIKQDKQTKVPEQNNSNNIIKAPSKGRTSSIFSNKIINKRKISKEKPTYNDVIKIGSKTEPVLDLYQPGSLQTSKTVSSTIITYPPTLNSSDHRTQEEKQRGSRIDYNSSKNSFDVHSGSYFTMPKSTKNVLDKSSIFKIEDKSIIRDAKGGRKKSEPTFKSDLSLADMENENKKVLRTMSSTDSVIANGSKEYVMQEYKSEINLLAPVPKHIFTKMEHIESKKLLAETNDKPVSDQNIDTSLLTAVAPAVLLLPGVAAISTINKTIDKDINDGIDATGSSSQTTNSNMTDNLGAQKIKQMKLKNDIQEKHEDKISQMPYVVENLDKSETDIFSNNSVEPESTNQTKRTQKEKDIVSKKSLNSEDMEYSKNIIPDAIKKQDYEKTKGPSSISGIFEHLNTKQKFKIENKMYPNEDLSNNPSDTTTVFDTHSEKNEPIIKPLKGTVNVVLSQTSDKSNLTLNCKYKKEDYDLNDALFNTKEQPTNVLDSSGVLRDPNSVKITKLENETYPTEDLKKKLSDTTKIENRSMKMEPLIKPLLIAENSTKNLVSTQNLDKSSMTLDFIHEKSDYDFRAKDPSLDEKGQINDVDMATSINKEKEKAEALHEIEKLKGELHHLWKNDMNPLDSSTNIDLSSLPLDIYSNLSNENLETLKKNQAEIFNFNSLPNKITSGLEKHPKENLNKYAEDIKDKNFSDKDESIKSSTVPIINEKKESLLSFKLSEQNLKKQTGHEDTFQSKTNVVSNQVQADYLLSPIKNNMEHDSRSLIKEAEQKNDLSSKKSTENMQVETLFPVKLIQENDPTLSNEMLSQSKYEKFQTHSSPSIVKPIIDSNQILPVNPTNTNSATNIKDKYESKSIEKIYDETEKTNPPITQGGKFQFEPQLETQLLIPESITKENNQMYTFSSMNPLGNTVENQSKEDDFPIETMLPPREYIYHTDKIQSISSQEHKVEAKPSKTDFNLVSNVEDFQPQSTFPISPQEDNDKSETMIFSPLRDSGESKSTMYDFQSESKGIDSHTPMLSVSFKDHFDQANAIMPQKANIKADSKDDSFNYENVLTEYTFPVIPKKDNEKPETTFSASQKVKTTFSEDDFLLESNEDSKFQAQSMHSNSLFQLIPNPCSKEAFDTVSKDLSIEQTRFLSDSKSKIYNFMFDAQSLSKKEGKIMKDKRDILIYDEHTNHSFDIIQKERGTQRYDQIEINPHQSPDINKGIKSSVNAEIEQNGQVKQIQFGDDKIKDNRNIPSPRQIKKDDLDEEIDHKIIIKDLETSRYSQILKPERLSKNFMDTANKRKNISDDLTTLQQPRTGLYQVNIAIQSYISNNNDVIIRSFNENEDPIRFPKDTIRIIHKALDIDSEIKIPIDSKNDFCIVIKQKDLGRDAHTLQAAMTDQLSEYDESESVKRKMIIADDVRKTLVAVYEEELLPLRSTIAELRVNIDMLKAFLKKQRPARVIPNYRKCSCMRR